MFHPLSSHRQHQLHRAGTRSIHMSERGHGASAAPQSAEAKRRQIANHRAKKSDLVQELPEVSPMRAIGVLCLSCDRLFPVVPTGRTFIQGTALDDGMVRERERERGKRNNCQLLKSRYASCMYPSVCIQVIEHRNPTRYHTFARADHPRRDGMTKHFASCPALLDNSFRCISPLDSSSSPPCLYFSSSCRSFIFHSPLTTAPAVRRTVPQLLTSGRPPIQSFPVRSCEWIQHLAEIQGMSGCDLGF